MLATTEYSFMAAAYTISPQMISLPGMPSFFIALHKVSRACLQVR